MLTTGRFSRIGPIADSVIKDFKTLYSLTFAPNCGATHRDRLESFYKSQAGYYDEFRSRLLHGREELFANLPVVPAGGHWVDLGGGTGSNLELISEVQRQALEQTTLVDLSPSLLSQAQQRIHRHGWRHVKCVEADVCEFTPKEQADWVTLSYSLTMIPDWFKAIELAKEILKPGGYIGVVDFYVQRKWNQRGNRHNWFQRTLWPAWFGIDNVFLNPDHLPFLKDSFDTYFEKESFGKVPYLGLKAPYYIFIGKRKL